MMLIIALLLLLLLLFAFSDLVAERFRRGAIRFCVVFIVLTADKHRQCSIDGFSDNSNNNIVNKN